MAIEQQILPDSAELHNRYSESVTTLAALDPVLGFWLRSKDVVRRLFTFENSIAAQNPEAASFWFLVQGPLMSEADKALKDAIRELAKKHSRATHRQVLERLARPPQDIPKELEEWVSGVIAQVKNTPPPGGSANPPQPEETPSVASDL